MAISVMVNFLLCTGYCKGVPGRRVLYQVQSTGPEFTNQYFIYYAVLYPGPVQYSTGTVIIPGYTCESWTKTSASKGERNFPFKN